MFNSLRRRFGHAKPNLDTTASAADDQLSRLPDELIIKILTKLDAQIPSLSTALPPSILLGKPKSPENTFPSFIKYYCYSIALITCLPIVVLLLCLVFRLFFRHHPYSWTALLAAVPAVRRFLSRHITVDRCLYILLNPVSMRALDLLFLLVRYAIYPLIRVPLVVFRSLIYALHKRIVQLAYSIYLPRVSASGRRFFLRLTRLNSLDVTFPSLWFDHPRLWIRGETKLIGKKPYIVFVAGDIVDHPNQYATVPIIFHGFWTVFKFYVVAWLRVVQVTRLVNLFPVAIGHSMVVRNVVSKNCGLNTMARYYFREVSSLSSVEIKQLSMKRKFKDIIGKFYQVYASNGCTLSLDHGRVQLRDAILIFLYLPISSVNNDDGIDVVDDDLIWACFGDEEEECKGNVEREELKEAVKVILSTPEVVALEIRDHYW